MKRLHGLFLIPLLLLSVPAAVQAVELLGDDFVLVDRPIEDDLFAAGNTVIINAPVLSAVVAGGRVDLNAPVRGDLIALGGVVNVSSDVEGKIVAAGGIINIIGNVTRNVVLAGGDVRILSTSSIGRDAIIAGEDVSNAGNVSGTLLVRAQSFRNLGTAGRVDFQMNDSGKEGRFHRGAVQFKVLLLTGFLIVGLLIIRLFKPGMDAVHREIIESPPKKALLGFLLIIASAVLIFIVAATVIGLPLAFIMLMLYAVALMLSNLFVANSLGKKVAMALKAEAGEMLLFAAGFVLLNLLFMIPLVGGLIEIISISLGFGAMAYAIRPHLMLGGKPDDLIVSG